MIPDEQFLAGLSNTSITLCNLQLRFCRHCIRRVTFIVHLTSNIIIIFFNSNVCTFGRRHIFPHQYDNAIPSKLNLLTQHSIWNEQCLFYPNKPIILDHFIGQSMSVRALLLGYLCGWWSCSSWSRRYESSSFCNPLSAPTLACLPLVFWLMFSWTRLC